MRKGYPKKHFRAADVSSVSSVRPRIDILHLLDQGTGLGRTWGGGGGGASEGRRSVDCWKHDSQVEIAKTSGLGRSENTAQEFIQLQCGLKIQHLTSGCVSRRPPHRLSLGLMNCEMVSGDASG